LSKLRENRVNNTHIGDINPVAGK